MKVTVLDLTVTSTLVTVSGSLLYWKQILLLIV